MITEDQLEQLAIQWFQDTGWSYVNGKVIAPEGAVPEREDLEPSPRPSPKGRGRKNGRLADAVSRLNPKHRPSSRPSPNRRRRKAVAEVVHVALTPEHPSLVQNNRAFQMGGLGVSVRPMEFES